MKNGYDYIIIGSGPAGATLAYELRNKKVLLLEKGPGLKDKQLGNFWGAAISPGFYNRLGLFNMSGEGTTVYASSNIGGTAVVSCGNMVRLPLGMFAKHGIDLGPFYELAEEEVGLNPVPDKHLILGTKAIMQASKRLGLDMRPMPKGMSPSAKCDLCGDCVLGCKRGAKWDPRSLINRANDNIDIMPDTRVIKVLIERGEAAGVRLLRKGKTELIRSENVILCAGGLGTPQILRRSRIEAGSGLFIDPFNVTYGIMDDIGQTRGMSMGALCDRSDEGFVLSPFMDEASQFLLLCPKWWQLKNRLPRKRVLGIMAKIPDERTGKVFADGSFSKRLTEQDSQRLSDGAVLAEQILKEAGAKNIITTKHPRGAHPGGTAAIGEVINKDFKVKGLPNLYVCDASVFPEAPGKPPILTIIALAKHLAQRLEDNK